MNKLQSFLCSCAVVAALAGGALAQNGTCLNNLVSNGNYTAGLVYGSMPAASVTDWTLLTQSPQVVDDGCGDIGSIQMWGNLVVGESVKQLLPGVGFEAGKQYRVTVCYRWLDTANPVIPTYVRFRLTAAGGLPTSYPPTSSYDLIGSTPNTSSSNWISYTFPIWTAPNNASWLTVNPENDESLNHGDHVSWGRIDDICIELVDPVTSENASWGLIKGTYR
jgi:hypothetical protein